MELKDMILSTLEELEEEIVEVKEEEKDEDGKKPSEVESGFVITSEAQFYENLRERILVLFEGFQSPKNKNIEAKVDLTLNFLEYLLSTIDERLSYLKSK